MWAANPDPNSSGLLREDISDDDLRCLMRLKRSEAGWPHKSRAQKVQFQKLSIFGLPLTLSCV